MSMRFGWPRFALVSVWSLGGSLTLTSLSSPAFAAAKKEIRFQWIGSGCGKSESVTPWDPMVVQLTASKDVSKDFTVRKGGGASPKEVRKNCDLIVSSVEPLQFAVERIEVKGSGTIPVDAQVDIFTETTSQGVVPPEKYALEKPKSMDKTFVLKKTIEDKDLHWSVCGRALHVSTKQQIKSGAIVDSKIEHILYDLQAKGCKK